MDAKLNTKFTAANCQRCGHSVENVHLKSIEVEINEQETILEEYIRCQGCGNLIEYYRETHIKD
jgi:uncharacterized protein with PIN domain